MSALIGIKWTVGVLAIGVLAVAGCSSDEPPERFSDTRSSQEISEAAEISADCSRADMTERAGDIRRTFVDTVQPGRSAGLLVDRPIVAPGESVTVVPFSDKESDYVATWVEIHRKSDDTFINEDQEHTADLVGVGRDMGPLVCYSAEIPADAEHGEYELRIWAEQSTLAGQMHALIWVK